MSHKISLIRKEDIPKGASGRHSRSGWGATGRLSGSGCLGPEVSFRHHPVQLPPTPPVLPLSSLAYALPPFLTLILSVHPRCFWFWPCLLRLSPVLFTVSAFTSLCCINYFSWGVGRYGKKTPDKGNLRGERIILTDSLKDPVYHSREGMVAGVAGSLTGTSHILMEQIENSGWYNLGITF